jgi:branched-chain amino acid transport system ATP-binding protein
MVGGPGVTFAPHAGAHGAASPDHADPERSDAVLALENVGVRFGGINALAGVSLTVAEGAVCGLIGPNGAGKTTLFDVISGVRTPNEGRVWFRGENITHVSAVARARRGLRRTFQRVQTFGWLSVEDNVGEGVRDLPHPR